MAESVVIGVEDCVQQVGLARSDAPASCIWQDDRQDRSFKKWIASMVTAIATSWQFGRPFNEQLNYPSKPQRLAQSVSQNGTGDSDMSVIADILNQDFHRDAEHQQDYTNDMSGTSSPSFVDWSNMQSNTQRNAGIGWTQSPSDRGATAAVHGRRVQCRTILV